MKIPRLNESSRVHYGFNVSYDLGTGRRPPPAVYIQGGQHGGDVYGLLRVRPQGEDLSLQASVPDAGGWPMVPLEISRSKWAMVFTLRQLGKRLRLDICVPGYRFSGGGYGTG